MKSRKNVCVIIDAYSTGSSLAGIILGLGYPCLHIKSSESVPASLVRTLKGDDFIEQIVYGGCVDDLCSYLFAKGYSVKCVIAGSEPGVVLADQLSEALGVETNGTALSQARRNKFIMHETVASHGLATIEQIKSGDLEAMLVWAKQWFDRHESVVLKPLQSSSTDGFHLCRNADQVIAAYKALYLSKDIFGNTNAELLMQQYIDGQEYCVNLVSCRGQSYVSDVWKINKRLNSHSKIYDLDVLINESDPEYGLLVEYAKRVIMALGIQHGPTHTEIMIDKTGRPLLIESAARLMGSLDIALVTSTRGVSASIMTAYSYLLPEVFQIMAQHVMPTKKCAALVQLISQEDGYLESYGIDELVKLPTYHGIDAYLKPGDRVKKTVDTLSSPGLVFLLGEDIGAIQADYQRIRSMEMNQSLYKVRKNNLYPIHALPTLMKDKNETQNLVKFKLK